MSSISSPPQNEALGLRLAAVRSTTGLSQGDFADTLGISPRAYANYERGEREMPVALFRALYEVHGIDPLWLLVGPGDRPLTAAARTIDVELLDRIIQRVDRHLLAARKKIKPDLRMRLLKAAYALSAERGTMDTSALDQLLAVAV